MVSVAESASEALRQGVFSFLTGETKNCVALIDAAPGSGKSFSLLEIAKQLIQSGDSVRVAIVTQTNNQANDLALSAIEERHGIEAGAVYRFVSDRISKPENFSGQWVTKSKGISRAYESMFIGTASKWIGLAADTKTTQTFDYVLIDECYQMTWSTFVQLLNLGSKFALIGDKGQIPPVVTVDASRWVHWDLAPNLPAPYVLRTKMRESESFRSFDLKHCRRLPAKSISYIAPFYTDSQGTPGVLPVAQEADRGLELDFDPRVAPDIQKTIRLSATGEPVLLSLGDETTGDPIEGDRELARAIKDLTRALLGQKYFIKDENQAHKQEGTLELRDIAVCSTKRAMNALIEDELQEVISDYLSSGVSSDESHSLANGGLLIDTPERLQGLQRKVMIAVHPLSNTLKPSGFDLDTGRLCVMASRHQVALIFVSRAHLKSTLERTLHNANQAPAQPDAVGRGHSLHLDFVERLYAEGEELRRVVAI